MNKSCFLGIGSYLPKKGLSNDDIALLVNTNDEWIRKRTGIVYRHIADLEKSNSIDLTALKKPERGGIICLAGKIVSKISDIFSYIGFKPTKKSSLEKPDPELTSDMAKYAATHALKDANILAEKIDLIVVATTTPDKTFPSCATIVQAKLGCKNAFAFDIQAACSGFLYAVAVVDEFIKSGKVKHALVIGADSMSKIVNWKDRSTCVLFGDGAGAVVIGANLERGILSTHLHSDGKVDMLCTSGGVGTTGNAGYICMDGNAVFRHGIEKLVSIIEETLTCNNLNMSDIDWLVPHQANIRIIEVIAKALDFPIEKVVITIDQHANTSAASIPLALDCAKDKIRAGNLVLLVSIGAGMTWASVLLRY